MTVGFAIILGLTIVYGYMNGVNSSASVVATIISSRAMNPAPALILAACGICVGPFLFGKAIANTIAVEFITPQATTVPVLISALIAAVLWSGVTIWFTIPSSVSQSLFGGLIGASWAGFGSHAIQTAGLSKILIALFVSPILGLFVALYVVRLIYFLSQWADPRINRWFNRGQVLTSALMALAFGANNGQIIIAVIALGLLAANINETFTVPGWVTIVSAATIGLGTLTGGMRIIKTVGGKFYKIRPIHGFGAQLSSFGIIFSAALLGGPVSSSQVVTSSILGAGSADRIQKVHWGVAQNILLGWMLTLPFSALFAVIAYQLVDWIHP
jgi:PiT family inorganic phosphate transporter